MTIGSDGSCPLVVLLPFTYRGKPHKERTNHTNLGAAAAALMAMEDFNARDASVVPQLADEEFAIENCDVYFPAPYDGGGDALTPPPPSLPSSSIVDDGDAQDATVHALLAVKSRADRLGLLGPCAVVGSVTKLAAESAAAFSAAMDVPYLSHAADTTRISRPHHFKLSAKVNADEYEKGHEVLSYLMSRGRDYITLVYSLSEEEVWKVLNKAAKSLGMHLRAEPMRPSDGRGPNTPYDAMRRIRESGYKTTIVCTPKLHHWDQIAAAAHEWGLDTDDHVWMPYDTTKMEIEILAAMGAKPGSPLDGLLRGSGLVRVLDGHEWGGDGGRFLESWRGRDENFVQRLNAANPMGEKGPLVPEDYFQDERYPLAASHVTFMYDAVVAVGMGACRARRKLRETEKGIFVKETVAEGLENPGKNLQYNETVAVQFDGASGPITLNDGESYSRNPSGIAFGVYNFRTGEEIDEETGKRRYDYALTAQKLPGQEWAEVSNQIFIFSDGTANEPMPLRDIRENNYLDPSVQAGGLTLFAIALFIGIAMAGWTFWKRNSPVVKAAQPEFLYCLCFGSIITTMAIICLSFDESFGMSVEQLSTMCTAAPWFFVLGYIIVYSALFSKLWRLSKVMEFRRRTVKVRNVMGPALILILLAIIVLAIWTGVDPWVWVRETVNEDTGETFGKCQSNNTVAFFVPLVALMMLATILAGFMAWKNKDVSSEYSEAEWIFYAIFTQIQVWFVGLPVLQIVQSTSVDATYLGRMLITWTFAVSITLLIIGPRMLETLEFCQKPQQSRGTRGSNRVTVSGVSESVASKVASMTSRRSTNTSTTVVSGRSSIGASESNTAQAVDDVKTGA